MSVTFNGLDISWLGYACARVEAPDGTVVYTDPGRYGTLTGEWADQYGGSNHPSGPAFDERDGDLVLVTHDHHYQSDGVRRVASPDATVIVYEEVDADRINSDDVGSNVGRNVEPPEDLPHNVERVAYGDALSVAGVEVDVIPAHNDPDGPRVDESGEPVHPPGFGCGFRFVVADTSLFWTGDSDVIEDHYDLDVTVFLPSIAQSFTMNRHEAADLAEELAPELVVPIHYNTFPDLGADSAAFASDVATRSIPVALAEEWPRRFS